MRIPMSLLQRRLTAVRPLAVRRTFFSAPKAGANNTPPPADAPGPAADAANDNADKAEPEPAAAKAAAPKDSDAFKKTIAEKDRQITLLQDAYRRALADAENVRQRTRKEIDDKQTYAIQKFAKDLLSTADVLEMALNAVPESARAPDANNPLLKSLHEGVAMTRSELIKTFKQYGVEPFSPLGEKFDPNLHQALFQAPIPNKEPGTVFEVAKVGYMLHGRVLRPAHVGVVKDTE